MAKIRRKVACLLNSSVRALPSASPKHDESPKYLDSFVPVNDNDRDAHHLTKFGRHRPELQSSAEDDKSKTITSSL